MSKLVTPGTGTVSKHLKKTLETIATSSMQQFFRHPNDPKIVGELCHQIEALNDETAQIGVLPPHQITTALRILLHDFQKTPMLIVQSRLRIVRQAFEEMFQLCHKDQFEKLKSIPPPHILAVDDDADVLAIVKCGLESIGMSVSSTRDPNQALPFLQSRRFNLVLLDIAMENLNGLELCSRIRKLEGYTRTPVIFLTGLATDDQRDQAFIVGGNDFIGKPFHASELGLKAIFWAIQDQIGKAAPITPLK